MKRNPFPSWPLRQRSKACGCPERPSRGGAAGQVRGARPAVRSRELGPRCCQAAEVWEGCHLHTSRSLSWKQVMLVQFGVSRTPITLWMLAKVLWQTGDLGWRNSRTEARRPELALRSGHLFGVEARAAVLAQTPVPPLEMQCHLRALFFCRAQATTQTLAPGHVRPRDTDTPPARPPAQPGQLWRVSAPLCVPI